MLKFEVGKHYNGTFIGDSDVTFEFEILARTSLRISIVDALTHEVKKIGVHFDEKGNEFAYPYGKYSMCPLIRAERFLT